MEKCFQRNIRDAVDNAKVENITQNQQYVLSITPTWVQEEARRDNTEGAQQ